MSNAKRKREDGTLWVRLTLLEQIQVFKGCSAQGREDVDVKHMMP
jgi:hypothetical protein